jgi:hypothetical protein
MSNYPYELDDDTTLIRIDDNVSQIGGQAINALRAAVFNIEEALGTGTPGGLLQTIALTQFLLQNQPIDAAGYAFAAPFFLPTGYVNPSFFVTLPALNNIGNSQISPSAGIQESKLALDYSTASLFSFIQQENLGIQQSLNFITNHGSKIEPHIQGINFNHDMNAILVSPTSINYFTNDQGAYRNNSNLYTLFNDLNTDYILHQVSNNLPVTFTNGQQTGGTVPPTNYGHVSAGIYLDTSDFTFIPQTTTDVQAFAEFVDGSNLLLLGSRIQTLYQNGIPRTAVSSALGTPGIGQIVIPATPAFTYLLDGYETAPIDSIIFPYGDNVIVFNPVSDDGYTFDALFSAIRIGDILTVNYGSFSVSNLITETKYLVDLSGTEIFAVRISGKNLQNTSVTATITRSLFNNDKFGVLALAQAYNINVNTGNVLPTLTVGNPHSAEVLSVNFNATLIDSLHYNLYLSVYPNGNPLNGVVNLPTIDISGNEGVTPGAYTLNSVVQTINSKFRAPGYNNRFMAFDYQGELGIKMTDSINNISFSITDGYVGANGLYNQSLSNTLFPNNVIDITNQIDPSGLGPLGAGVSGPQFSITFSSSLAAQIPTKIIAPSTTKTFYVNGSEQERFAIEPFQTLDGYGDGYWPATIIAKNVNAGGPVTVTYQIALNLSTASLQIGRAVTVQPALGSVATFVDSGRYLISNIQFIDCDACDPSNANIAYTNITVYDAIQSPTGMTPYASAPVGTAVNIYFSADSVGFNAENLSDPVNLSPFKRFMEIYVDDAGDTFGHERARIYTGGTNANFNTVFSGFNNGYGLVIGSPNAQQPLFGDSSGGQPLNQINIMGVSPQLRGFPYGIVNKINLQITSYDGISTYDGYLCNFNISSGITSAGPMITGKVGEVTRFYDQTSVAYVDLIFTLNNAPPNMWTGSYIDIQLFPSLQFDQDVMLLGSVQVNNQNNTLAYLTDLRQFGNISEEQLSTSAITFIQSGDQYLQQNGIVRGFSIVPGPANNQVSVSGGLALVNGQLIAMNNDIVSIPIVREYYNSQYYPINWLLCINSESEFTIIPLTDYDATLGTISNAITRLVIPYNAITSTLYPVAIDSDYFTNIVTSRKDLTPLYVIASTVTGITPALTISDARKYVLDGNSSIRPTITDQLTQGNFQSVQSSLTWFKFNGVYQNTLHVKSTYVLTSDPGFSPVPVNVISDGYGAEIQFSFVGHDNTGTTTNIINTNFSNLTVIFDTATITISNGIFTNCVINDFGTTTSCTSVTFINCSITISGGTSLTNCTFTNCTISIGGSSAISNTVFNICTITLSGGASLSSPVTFNNCTLATGGIVTVTSNCAFNECVISNTTPLATVFFINSTATEIQFAGCNCTYLPTTSGTPYSASNLINDGYGFIYSSSALLQNIMIANCTFTTNTSTRFSFINFDYAGIASVMQTIHITNNQFFNTSSIDDIYSVIAVIWPNPSNVAQPTEGLKLIDCLIQNNLCDKNQMIAIASGANGSGAIQSSIVPVATRITGNSCGTIGVTGAADNERNYNTATAGIAYDKSYGVIIADNICRFIGQINSTGISCFNQTRYTSPAIPFDTCSMVIQRNACAWIQLIPNIITSPATPDVTAYQQNAVISVLDNSLRSYTTTFLGQFSTNPAVFNNAAIAILAPDYSINVLQAIIRGNTVMQGSALTSSNTIVTYDYVNCAYLGLSCVVDQNIFSNLQTGNDMLYHASSATSIMNITNNQFWRNGNTVNSYINFVSTTVGVIGSNSFDSTTTNGTSTALIAGTFDGVFNFNYNYSPNLTRLIAQPNIPITVLGTVTDAALYVILATDSWAYFKMTKMINGASLNTVTVYYNNSTTLNSAPTFYFAEISNVGTFINASGTQTGVVTAGQQSTTYTFPTPLAINDQLTTYAVFFANSSSSTVDYNLTVLGFVDIAYLGQN